MITLNKVALADPVWMPLWLALLVAIPTIITAFSNAYNVISLAKLRRATQVNHSKIEKLEENTNGKMDKLLDTKDELRVVAVAAAHAAGKLEGKAE